MGRSPRRRAQGRRNRRRVGGLRPRKTLLVFCEGERTEPEYLRALKREPSIREAASVEIRLGKHTIGKVPPLKLVQEAVKARKRASAERAEIDEVWCLFDVEWPQNHPRLHQALDLARSCGEAALAA